MTARIEDRVRRAFGAEAAGLVPDHDLAPSVIARGRRTRRVRRTGAALAVAAAVAAAIVVPGALTNIAAPQPVQTPPVPVNPTDPAVPADALPQGAPPKILYAENAAMTGSGFLYDGSARLPIAKGRQVVPFGRVPGGWFVLRADALNNPSGWPQDGEFGVLRTDGDFVSFGAAGGWLAALSPDGSQVVYVSGGRFVVADLATGVSRAGRPTSRDEVLLGWNPDGIWFRSAQVSADGSQPTYVWRPGTQPRRVRDAGWLQVERRTARMTDLRAGADNCVAVVELRSDDRLERLWRHCSTGPVATAAVSPDGRYVALADGTVYRIGGGVAGRIRALDEPGVVPWEDATHLLLHTSSGTASSTRELVVRCDIVTHRCERAYDKTITGSYPSPRLTLREP